LTAPLDKMKVKVSRGAAEKSMKEEYVSLFGFHFTFTACKLQDILVKINETLEDGKHLRFLKWNEREIEVLNQHLFLTAKPMVYLVNLSKDDFIKKKNKW
jgi:ribosome-binding ATPase YchF (GTP1/OBG family)